MKTQHLKLKRKKMKQEEKDLLLKDLCSRLPYGVMASTKLGSNIIVSFIGDDIIKGEDGDSYDISFIKPYLRPISSMTEEEVDKLFDILNLDKENETEWLKVNDINIIRLFTQEGKDFYEIAEAMDYLYSIHVDFRGLIEKGLAIDATGLNIY